MPLCIYECTDSLEEFVYSVGVLENVCESVIRKCPDCGCILRFVRFVDSRGDFDAYEDEPFYSRYYSRSGN